MSSSFLCPRCHLPLTSREIDACCAACGLVLALADGATLDGEPVLPVERDLSGARLGGYVLEARIGSGGMGVVYRARRERDGAAVALKVLAQGLAGQPDVTERFRREAATLELFRHPNIVEVREHGETQGRAWLCMELLDGESLAERLQRGRLTVTETLRVGTAVARALVAAHARGVTHRDLKPANIVLTGGADEGSVKVVDFGIARLEAFSVTLTHSEALLGTLSYMAPEQRTRAALVDHRADLFSLGVVLYEALTGVLPVGAFEPASHLAPGVPARLDRLIQSLLGRLPEKRVQTAERVLAALEDCRPREPMTRPWRRRDAQVAIALALAAGGAVVWSAWRVPPPVSAPPDEAPHHGALTTAPLLWPASPESLRELEERNGPEGTMEEPPSKTAEAPAPDERLPKSGATARPQRTTPSVQKPSPGSARAKGEWAR